MSSLARSIFKYFFAPTPREETENLERLHLARKQLDAIQTSKDALIKAYNHFKNQLNVLKDKRNNVELLRWETLAGCDSQEEEKAMEDINQIMNELDQKIEIYEDKLMTMKENVDYLHQSERKVASFIHTIHEMLQFSSRDESIQWDHNQLALGDFTTDSYLNFIDESDGESKYKDDYEDDYEDKYDGIEMHNGTSNEENDDERRRARQQNYKEKNLILSSDTLLNPVLDNHVNGLPEIPTEVKHDPEVNHQLSKLDSDRGISNALDALHV